MDIKELFKNLKQEDYYKKANFHIHTLFSDGTLTPNEAIQKALEKNLEYISITDHNSIEAYKNIDNSYNINLITGVEFDCWYKTNFMHLLGYGIDINNPELNSICAKSKKETEWDIVRLFTHRQAKDVINAIHSAGGIAVLAHPCCCWNLNIKKMITELKDLELDGVETFYLYKDHRNIVRFHDPKKLEQITEELNLLKTGGTDCHSKNILGR